MFKLLRYAVYRFRDTLSTKCPVCEFPKKKVGEDMCPDCKLKEERSISVQE